MEYVLLVAILVVCVYKYGKFGAWGKKVLAIRWACITSKSETGDYSKVTYLLMHRLEAPGHVPSADVMVFNEVAVNTADDCFYKNVDGVIVKYTRS